MYYVELLRVVRSLRVTAIVLAAALVLNIALWYAAHGWGRTGSTIPLEVVWAFAGLVTCIFASIISGSLAFENDGHLALAWTKPVSKTVHALVKIGLDVAGIGVCFLMSCVAVYIYFAAIGVAHALAPTSYTMPLLERFLLAPLAFYGLVQALTCGLARQAGMVVGMTWVACMTLIGLQASGLPQPFHSVVDFISYANPMVYIAFDVNDKGDVITAFGLGASALALTLIAGLGSALAIYRWQRVEA